MIGFSSIKKLFGGLAKSRDNLTRRLTEAFGGGRLDEVSLEAIEEALIAGDVGVGTASRIVGAVREKARGMGDLDAGALRDLVAAELAASFEEAGTVAPGGPETSGAGPGAGAAARAMRNSGAAQEAGAASGAPRVVLVVGVNGGGKTTTVAKLAALHKSSGRTVLLAAADTFRAAATEQLVTWGSRADVPVIRHADGADPGAVVFDAARAALARNADLLIVDTAGRLHTKSNLMQELTKIARVVGREIPGAPHEVLLVLDATTGQNGLAQAREFARAVPVSGLVLTKLDGTARGGVALAIARELRIPIRFIGVGEAMDDLLEFDPRAFVASLLGSESEAQPAEAP